MQTSSGTEPGPPYRPIFVVGCPRSGTTWVQLLLSQHPAVATAPETQIFAYYLDGFLRQWRVEHEGPGRELQGRSGLSRLLDDAAFHDLLRVNARYVLDRIHAGCPRATHVLEKSPRHALHVPLIQRLFPEAWILHVVRDPRDTAASIMAAARSWGRGWAPPNPIEAARMWMDNVSAARAGSGHARYREIRFEVLKADQEGTLTQLLNTLGLPASPDQRREIIDACRMERLREKSGDSAPVPGEKNPTGFFRRGKVGGWREDLSRLAVSSIEAEAGALMAELGYERSGPTWPGRARGRIHDGVVRVREAVDWQLQRLSRRI